MSIKLVLLGNAQLLVDGQPIKLPTRALQLLVYLALMGQSSRDDVNNLIWQDNPSSARKRLDEFKRLAPGLLSYSRHTIQLGPDVEVDVPHIRDSLIAALKKNDSRFCLAKAHYLYGAQLHQALVPALESVDSKYQAWLEEQRREWEELRLKFQNRFANLKAYGNHAFSINEKDLLGLDEHIEYLLNWLYSDKEYRILRIEGIGGIGKTTLAKAFAQKVHREHHFDVIFLDRKEINTLTSRTDKTNSQSMIGIDTHLKKLFDLLGIPSYAGLREQRMEQLRHTLVVIDNVDNQSDIEPIKHFLEQFQDTDVHFVLTSRLNLSEAINESERFSLQHLSENDSITLLRKSLPENIEISVADAQKINKRINGIPLALRLVGQLFNSMTVDEICQHLDKATNAETDRVVNEIFREIYEEIWQRQDETAKDVWVHIAETMNPGGVPLDRLKELLVHIGHSNASILSACEKLAQHYIITRGDNPHAVFYFMHHLTCQFIQGDFHTHLSESNVG